MTVIAKTVFFNFFYKDFNQFKLTCPKNDDDFCNNDVRCKVVKAIEPLHLINKLLQLKLIEHIPDWNRKHAQYTQTKHKEI